MLRLDNAERLSPGDHGLLAELAGCTVGDVRIVVCVTPHHQAGDEIIRQVTLRGIEPHLLGPLDRPAVEQWLQSEQIPRGRWDTISRLSSGYPFFIADAVRLTGAGESLDGITAPDGFEALLRASWRSIPESIRATVAKLAPFANPPSDDFIREYLGYDVLQWGILTDSLIDSGIFVHRSDGEAWFHDRRRAFIWDRVLTAKQRAHVAESAFNAVAKWLESRSEIEPWVPSATAVLARETKPAAGSLIGELLALPDDAIALLWGLIEVIEPGSALAPFAEIGEAVRHAESRSGRTIDALRVLTQLESQGLVETKEAEDARLVRSMVRHNTEYAALLGEVLLRFHASPRPRFASAAFDAFIRPALGTFSAAIVTLGSSTLVEHKHHLRLLRDPQSIGSSEKLLALGGTVTIEDQQLSFTVALPTRETRAEAEGSMRAIGELASRVQLDRLLALPQPRLRYARYRLAVEAMSPDLGSTLQPHKGEVMESLDQRTKLAQALASVSTTDEIEILGLGRRRFLTAARGAPQSWTTFEVRTEMPQATLDISELEPRRHDPLLELRLREHGILDGRERMATTVHRYGKNLSMPHPLAALLDDIDQAGEKYNSGLRSVLFAPDADTLHREIVAERKRVAEVIGALESAGVVNATVPGRSLLLAFWEDSDTGWVSDFGSWTAWALEVDDGQDTVVVLRLPHPPDRISRWPAKVPDVFVDQVGAKVVSSQDGDASSIIAPLLGYADRDARMMDLEGPLGRIVRSTYDIVGDSE